MDEARQFRAKATDIENVVPAISTWDPEKVRRYRYTDLNSKRMTLEPAEFAHLDPHPMPKPVDREGYLKEENSDRYWASGLADWTNIRSAIDRFQTTSAPARLLDFGCASGRVLRHVLAQPNSIEEIWGCDLAPANVDWIKRHLPDTIQCVPNEVRPKLPFEDGYFDVVTAFSVFTHIDHEEIDWLRELKRITRTGGLLYLTIHNEATWKSLADRPGIREQLKSSDRFDCNPKFDSETLDGPLPQERFVIRKDLSDVYNCNVWHSDQYIHREWGKLFEILHIANNAHGNFQTPVIMRAP